MLYEKSKGEISKELFQNPTCEFRGAPFWAWNGKLDEEEIAWQTGVFKEMGFGGYHMHVRTGLTDEYLGDKFNQTIASCVDASVKNNMLAWLYDEDRWPSGFAGGLVTKDPAYRQRYLHFTDKKIDDAPKFNEKGVLIADAKPIAAYEVHTFFGKLRSYKRVGFDQKANRYAYLRIADNRTWFNNYTYVDTLNKEAMDKFADITYGAYQRTVGKYLGNVCPAIFTDEPQVYWENDFFKRAWTDDFADTYLQAYGEDILDKLPEVFFGGINGKPSAVRHHYLNHLADRFANAFADNLGEKAEKVGLKLTGHMMCEDGWHGQTAFLGECMRHYRGFGLPGIDMLCSHYEFITAKQCQSVVCQNGKEGMLSELYGVSRWNYDFRLYKLHGDWQAALGVTIRVPHLSMMTMKGEAKRDYPASIFYQSPWYKKYPIVEDHFARVNTALTNGKQICDIAVIHPIESFWFAFGKHDLMSRYTAYRHSEKLPEILLKSGLDFHYISESLLPEQCADGGYPLTVGQMQYKVIVLPAMTTIRATTLDRLAAFSAQGGKIVLMDSMPTHMDGVPSNRPAEVLKNAIVIPFDQKSLLAELEPYRLVGFYDKKTGKHTDNIIYSLKEKANGRWLFAARANKKRFPNPDIIRKQDLKIVVDGEWKATLWNTLDGSISDMAYVAKDGKTEIAARMYNHDSLLIRLEESDRKSNELSEEKKGKQSFVLADDYVPFTLHEENVVLLDRARYALDNEKYSTFEKEILALDNVCRKKMGYPLHGGEICQPWAAVKRPADHRIRLRFEVFSEIEYADPALALEDAELAEISLNGEHVDNKIIGWYVDKSIKKVALPSLKKGKNVIEISLPFGENTDTEWCYLLGNFGVKVKGAKKTVIELPKTLEYGPVRKQGLPFYGGKLTYHTAFVGTGKTVSLQVPSFRSAVVEADCLGEHRDITYAPYIVDVPSNDGKTELDLSVYISRENAFGPVHNRIGNRTEFCYGPGAYRGNFLAQAKRYVLVNEGIITPPLVYFDKK